MSAEETIAFPVERFIAAGIPREASVELTVRGVFYAYGEITAKNQLSRWPTHSEFREIAGGHERWEVREVEVDCEGGGMAEGKSLEFTLKKGFVDGLVERASHQYPVAVLGVWFSYATVVKPTALRVADLAFVTYRDGLLWLEGKPLDWEDEDFHGYPDYEVIADGGRFTTEQYWCNYGGPKGDLLEGLMDLQLRARCSSGDIQREDAGTVLRDMPERWVDVARDFIERYGWVEAERVIGADNLKALLCCELWERLTAEPIEDKRQLHLWPTAATPI